MWHILLYSLLAYLAPFIQQSIRYQLKWRPLPLRKWNERIYCHSFSVYIHFLFSFIPKSVMWSCQFFIHVPSISYIFQFDLSLLIALICYPFIEQIFYTVGGVFVYANCRAVTPHTKISATYRLRHAGTKFALWLKYKSDRCLSKVSNIIKCMVR